MVKGKIGINQVETAANKAVEHYAAVAARFTAGVRLPRKKGVDPHRRMCDAMCGGAQWQRIFNSMIG